MAARSSAEPEGAPYLPFEGGRFRLAMGLMPLAPGDWLEIDGNLARVKKATQVNKARELLLAAVAYSRRHFDKEERVVFPMAERVLKNKTLTALGQTWMNERTRVAV